MQTRLFLCVGLWEVTSRTSCFFFCIVGGGGGGGQKCELTSVYFVYKHEFIIFVVCFLLGNSPASEFYIPTFRNTVFHLHRRVGMNRVFRNVGIQNSDAGELPSRKNTTFRTRRKLEIKNTSHLWGEKCNNSVPKRRHTKFRHRGITQ